jgi:uncharacterized membrane protein
MEFLADLHPKIIHFPIAFFILYSLFETASVIFKKEFLSKSAFIILILGVVFSLLAVLTGNQAHELVKKIQIEAMLYESIIAKHELYATITLWYFTSLLFFRVYFLVKKKFIGKIVYVFVLLGLLGIYFIYMTGLLGGELVFKYGIGIKLQ